MHMRMYIAIIMLPAKRFSMLPAPFLKRLGESYHGIPDLSTLKMQFYSNFSVDQEGDDLVRLHIEFYRIPLERDGTLVVLHQGDLPDG